MRILMISSYLPYPLFSGGQVRLYNLIKELSQKHEITLICEKRSSQTIEDIRQVERICKKVITVDRRKQWSIRNLLKTGFSNNSFLFNGHINSEMRHKIEKELDAKKYDIIHVETYYVMQNLPETTLPIVLAEHNIEYLVYKKYVDQAPIISRPILSLDIAKIKKEEEYFWKEADGLIAVSKDDQKVMEDSGLKPSIVSNGVDTEKFGFKKESGIRNQESGKILFIGDFKWIQNRDSVKFIIEEIWPLIKLKSNVIPDLIGDPEIDSRFRGNDNLKLWIVGREIPDFIKNFTQDLNVIFDEDSSLRPTEELFQEADILLAPIRIGGGTSYKILESMSCGTPVVTTQISADAIEAKDSRDIMVGKDPKELADKTLELLNNNKLYESMAIKARKLIEEKYTWKKIAKDLGEVYKDVIASE